MRDRSIRDNARFHIRQSTVLKVDISNFFGSIRYNRVVKLFLEIGYTPEVAVMLAKLCTFANALPQGAPTSPALSNIVSFRLDLRISAYAKRQKIRYTRYADDLTFSGPLVPGALLSFLKMVLAEDSLAVNRSKTRLMQKHQRQQVTGIVLNEGMNAPRNSRRKLRQAAFYIEKYGLDSHLARIQNATQGYSRHLLGKANFALFVNPQDRDAQKLVARLHKIHEEEQS